MVRGTLKLAPYTKYALESPVMAPMMRFALWYSEVAKRKPFLTGFITTGIKTSAADLFAQKVVEGTDQVDWKRNMTFTCFGFWYLGGFQYMLYNNVFPKISAPLVRNFRTHGRGMAVVAKVFADQALHHPFIYFPAFFAFKGLALGEADPISYAKTKYENEIVESVKALWMVWVPCQLLNFAVVPKHFTIPFVAGVSFGWTVILSCMQAIFDKPVEAVEAAGGGGDGTEGKKDSEVVARSVFEHSLIGEPLKLARTALGLRP